MSEQISKHKWAAIIYGRSYHVDFRFITLPKDFSKQRKEWASQYILATLHEANKLSSCPRWSFFKDESHCVVGVTCMVRDLLQNIISQEGIESFSKDNKGRHLYIFVGYVTRLNQQQSLLNFPLYSEDSLQPFQNLYQHILNVWQIEEYKKHSKEAFLDEYQTINFDRDRLKTEANLQLERPINHQEKQPNNIYLWQNTPDYNQKLWIEAAICDHPTSICLGNQKLKHIIDSPFLNQTIDRDSLALLNSCFLEKTTKEPSKSFNKNITQLISNKAKKDIETTLHNARVIKNKSQYLLENISDIAQDISPFPSEENTQKKQSDRTINSSFGFKTKSNEQKNRETQEWF